MSEIEATKYPQNNDTVEPLHNANAHSGNRSEKTLFDVSVYLEATAITVTLFIHGKRIIRKEGKDLRLQLPHLNKEVYATALNLNKLKLFLT